MKLVKGRDLKRVFELVFAGEEGWNETRALGVIDGTDKDLGLRVARRVDS
jgi:hypothetical protein